ncbi:hypothetical protein FS749_010458 [Ceratobasidium sp. UAMH 11750]|nr:hypothetical protein FS749_010458 [Ceratobasidium sp. UAMH 11750]
MTPATNILDHIAHLSPPGKLSDGVAYWESLGFKVIPGGQHNDGLATNALIPLADGIYIELFAFEKPASVYPPDSPRSKHWWATKEPGWIDWAYLTLEDNLDKTIAQREERARSGVLYEKGKIGGRTRAEDGVELKWRVWFPEAGHGRGSVPFFCLDLTPRELRVPSADAETHPNSALGISHFHLSVPEDRFSQVRAQLSVVLGSEPDESNEWELALPRPISTRVPRLKLSAAESGVTASSIEEVGFFVSKPKDKVDAPKGFGRVVFVEV